MTETIESEQEILSTALLQSSNSEITDNPPPKQLSWWGVFFVLINTTIGSGTLLVPYCFRCGLGLVLTIAGVMAGLAFFSLYMLLESSRQTGQVEYERLFAHCFGEKWVWIMHVWIIVILFGSIIIYDLMSGKLIMHLLNINFSPFNNLIFWNFMVAVLLIFPLTLFKSLKPLEKWSGLALFFILVLTIHALYWLIYGIKKDGFKSSKIEWFKANKQLITSFGVFSMAYDCHCNIFAALRGLPNPTIQRKLGMSIAVIVFSFCLYMAFGIFTYFHLFDDLGPDPPMMYYPISNWFTKITIIGVVLILVLGAPVVIFPIRNSFIHMIWKSDSGTLVWVLVGAGITLLATICTFISSNVVFFFDLIGGIFTPGFVFTLPSIFYLKIVKNAHLALKILAVFTTIISIGASVAATYQVIKGA